MMKHILLLVVYFLIGTCTAWSQSSDFRVEEGRVSFVSEAPLELIKASSNELEGILKLETQQFAFQVQINSFEGFNNPLQRIHFQENYLETDQFPTASFVGKIVDEVDLASGGQFEVRAKGMFTIHGIEKEQIIKVRINVTPSGLIVESSFNVLLVDHNIRVPRIVYQKIAKEISVSVQLKMN